MSDFHHCLCALPSTMKNRYGPNMAHRMDPFNRWARSSLQLSPQCNKRCTPAHVHWPESRAQCTAYQWGFSWYGCSHPGAAQPPLLPVVAPPPSPAALLWVGRKFHPGGSCPSSRGYDSSSWLSSTPSACLPWVAKQVGGHWELE